MRKRKVLVVAISTLLIGGISTVAERMLRAQHSGLVPLTAERVNVAYDATGNVSRRTTETYARRSDGSWAHRRFSTSANGAVFYVQTLMEANLSRSRTFDSRTRSVTTIGYPPSEMEPYKSKPRDCRTDDPQQFDTVLDIKVLKVTTRLPSMPGKERIVEEWIAPSLDCFPMRQIFYEGGSGRLAPVFEKRVSVISVGVVDGALFTPPPNYEERPPSFVLGEHKRLQGKGGICTQCEIDRDKILDDRYYKSKTWVSAM